ncbi:hypothetical protein BDR04DRAFT_611285, partial [Suillus decipiens]
MVPWPCPVHSKQMIIDFFSFMEYASDGYPATVPHLLYHVGLLLLLSPFLAWLRGSSFNAKENTVCQSAASTGLGGFWCISLAFSVQSPVLQMVLVHYSCLPLLLLCFLWSYILHPAPEVEAEVC